MTTSGPPVRPPAVAGTFYPAEARRLRAEVEACLDAAPEPGPPAPRAVVAPHAGYVYSGPIAGSAFRAAAPLAGRLRRVVVLGPSHFVAFDGLALPEAERFETPLGELAVDPAARRELAGLPQIRTDDRPHEREHALEVELPFLQHLFGDVAVVPLVVGRASPEEVAEAIERLWDDETLVVVSTDLSHYLDYESARARDQATGRAILALDESAIGEMDACGRHPLRGLLVAARRRGLAARELDLRSSGDTAGPRDRVVGYGAYAFA